MSDDFKNDFSGNSHFQDFNFNDNTAQDSNSTNFGSESNSRNTSSPTNQYINNGFNNSNSQNNAQNSFAYSQNQSQNDFSRQQNGFNVKNNTSLNMEQGSSFSREQTYNDYSHAQNYASNQNSYNSSYPSNSYGANNTNSFNGNPSNYNQNETIFQSTPSYSLNNEKSTSFSNQQQNTFNTPQQNYYSQQNQNVQSNQFYANNSTLNNNNFSQSAQDTNQNNYSFTDKPKSSEFNSNFSDATKSNAETLKTDVFVATKTSDVPNPSVFTTTDQPTFSSTDSQQTVETPLNVEEEAKPFAPMFDDDPAKQAAIEAEAERITAAKLAAIRAEAEKEAAANLGIAQPEDNITTDKKHKKEKPIKEKREKVVKQVEKEEKPSKRTKNAFYGEDSETDLNSGFSKKFFSAVNESEQIKKEGPSVKKVKKLDKRSQPISFGKLLVTRILLIIPVFGFIYMFALLLGRKVNKNIKAYAVTALFSRIMIYAVLVGAYYAKLYGYLIEWVFDMNGWTSFSFI